MAAYAAARSSTYQFASATNKVTLSSSLCKKSNGSASFSRAALARSSSSSTATSSAYDVVVVGGGPGGYVAAIKAAQLGLKTACVEKRGTLGGTCLNVGCIPSKALLHNTHLLHVAQHEFRDRGIDTTDVKPNVAKMMAYKTSAVSSLTSGIEMLFKKNGVHYIRGHGSCASPNEVTVTPQEHSASSTVLKTKHIVLATGSEPSEIPGVEINETDVVSSTGALALTTVPRSMLVIGAGVIGLELGSVWARLGAKVTVVDAAAAICGGTLDGDIAKTLRRGLEDREKIKFIFNAKVSGVTPGSHVDLLVSEGASQEAKAVRVDADVVLVSVGRRPVTAGLGLENLGLSVDKRGRIPVDVKTLATKTNNVWAIGDVIEGPMLAHKAEEEGIAVAETIASMMNRECPPGHVNYAAIPSVIYTYPEVAWVGHTEASAKTVSSAISVAKFPFLANSRAKANGEPHGLVKIVTDKETDRILGAHIIGPNAGEMIAEATLAIEYGASSEDIARTCHAHPTLSEAFKEACLAAHGLRKAIHM